MNLLAFLLQHKIAFSLITLVLLIWVSWGVLSNRPATLEPAQELVSEKQSSKMKQFKSGHYHLSKGKTW